MPPNRAPRTIQFLTPFRMLLRAYSSNLDPDRGVTILRGTSVSIRSTTPVATQSDGDPFGETPVAVRVAPRSPILLTPA